MNKKKSTETQQILTDEQVEERPYIEINYQSQTATVQAFQEDKQSERRSNSTEQELHAKKVPKPNKSMKKQSVVENLKWLGKNPFHG